MPEIILTNVTKRWERFYAVDNLNLKIDDHAFVTLLGPSGCGKTTILRMIAGLETPSSGRITIGGRAVFDSETGVNIPPNKRNVGFLFQNYALWPNMTVYGNIAFGLSNVRDEMPRVDFAARRAGVLLQVLHKADEAARLIGDCRDKAGRVDDGKACLRLIDHFDITMGAARTLTGYRLHESPDPAATARPLIQDLATRLDAIRRKHAGAGIELNEQYEMGRGGKPETSKRKLSGDEVDLSVRRVARVVKIGMYMDRYPNELSGGQQQRVAIARTLAPEPDILFMDEPLSNLDAKLRLEMRAELQRLHVDTGITMIYVTHDQMEAMTLATRICLLDNGVTQQYDAPLRVYGEPANLFTADFVGSPAINFIEAAGNQESDGNLALSLPDGREALFVPDTPLDLPAWLEKTDHALAVLAEQSVDKVNKDYIFSCHFAVTEDGEGQEEGNGRPYVPGGEDGSGRPYVPGREEFVLGVRPEMVRIGADGPMEGEIYSAMPTGMETTVRIKAGRYLLTGVEFGGALYRIGQPVRVSLADGGLLLFSRHSGRLIARGSLRFVEGKKEQPEKLPEQVREDATEQSAERTVSP